MKSNIDYFTKICDYIIYGGNKMKEKNNSAKRTIIIIYIVTITILTIIYLLQLQELTFKNIILSVLNSILTTLPAIILILTIYFGMINGAKKAIKETIIKRYS